MGVTKEFFRNRSLFYKFFTLSVLPVLLAISFIFYSVLPSQQKSLVEEEQQRTSLLVEFGADSIANEFAFYNKQILDNLIEQLVRDDGIDKAAVVDFSDNRVLSHSDKQQEGTLFDENRLKVAVDSKNKYLASSNIEMNGVLYGAVYIVCSLDQVAKRIERVTNYFYLMAVGVLLIGVVFSYFMARIISKPISELVDQAKYIGQGNFNHKIIYRSKDLLGQLVDQLNTMAGEIQTKQQQLIDSEAHLRTVINTIPDLVWLKDPEGKYLSCNTKFELLLGATEEQIIGKTDYEFMDKELADHFRNYDNLAIENGGPNINEEKVVYASDCHTEILETVKTPVFTKQGEVVGVLGIGRDITSHKITIAIKDAKLRLLGKATAIATDDLLQAFLDEAEMLTKSRIGFFHFIDEEKDTVQLHSWSTSTLSSECSVKGRFSHYPMSEAGMWIECVRKGEPVIQNDYPFIANKADLPEGHIPLIRYLTFPIMRDDTIVAVFGLGNKEQDYTDEDVHIVRELADLSWEMIQYKRSETARRQSDERYRSMMEALQDGAYICSDTFCIEYLNPAMKKIIGHDATGETCYKAIYGNPEKCSWCPMHKVQQGQNYESEVVHPDSKCTFHVIHSPLRNQDGTISKVTICRDVSHVKAAEEKLRQTQKLESIGNLAGGIAHDFNNLLTPIIGMAEILQSEFSQDDPAYQYVDHILKAAERAGELVNQILTFSRESEQKAIPLRLQNVLKDVYKLCRISIPADIPLTMDIQPDCELVLADPIQIHQVGMNLITNAYHAVEKHKGTISISLHQTFLDDVELANSRLEAGHYAVFSCMDTGCGMPPEVIERIFEPYFTTKEKGKGSGLGMSVVFGIVKDHNGDILISSEVGRGTEIKVLLPIMDRMLIEEQNVKEQPIIRGGTEKILIVDDDPSVLELLKQHLERLGYTVSTRVNSIEALQAFQANKEKFDLVITDMTMPGMTGDVLAQNIIVARPDIPIIICTGFSERIDEKKAKSLGIHGFLKKPVLRDNLAEMVRNLLDFKDDNNPSSNRKASASGDWEPFNGEHQ